MSEAYENVFVAAVVLQAYDILTWLYYIVDIVSEL